MKYDHVKIVAKVPCTKCEGGLVPGADVACLWCEGRGERETELLHPGEPFMLVRGKDLLAIAAIAGYKSLALYGSGYDEHAVDGLDDLLERVRDWQTNNPGLVKLPD